MVIALLIVFGVCLGSFVNAFVWRFHRQEELREERTELAAKALTAHGKSQKTVKATAAFKTSKAHKTAARTQADISAESSSLSIATGRSMCPHCKHELAPKDLVPVFSFLLLRGRCRYCRARIDDTPLPELLTPLLFVVSFLYWPYELSGVGLFSFILWLVVLVGFVILTIYDLRWYLLPDKIVFPLIGLALLQVILVATVFDGGWHTILGAIYGVLTASGVFFALHVVSKGEWIGGGDVTLGVLLGLLVGGPAHGLLLIFIASLIGTAVALPLLITGKASRTSHLPFGPFLIAAAVVVMLFGERLVTWYTESFIS